MESQREEGIKGAELVLTSNLKELSVNEADEGSDSSSLTSVETVLDLYIKEVDEDDYNDHTENDATSSSYTSHSKIFRPRSLPRPSMSPHNTLASLLWINGPPAIVSNATTHDGARTTTVAANKGPLRKITPVIEETPTHIMRIDTRGSLVYMGIHSVGEAPNEVSFDHTHSMGQLNQRRLSRMIGRRQLASSDSTPMHVILVDITGVWKNIGIHGLPARQHEKMGEQE